MGTKLRKNLLMVTKTKLDTKLTTLVNAYVSKITLDTNLNIMGVILFGSVAMGNNRKDSDIDLAIISPKFSKNRHKHLVTLLYNTIGIDSRIEPHPMTIEDLNNPYYPLASEIKKHGIKIL